MKPCVIPAYQHHLFRALLWVSLGVVLYLSCMKVDGPLPGNLSDKFYHGLCFFILAFMADFAYPDSGFTAGKYLPLFMYGVLIEIIQFFIPYRSFSPADMVADALGLVFYALTAGLLQRLWTRLLPQGKKSGRR